MSTFVEDLGGEKLLIHVRSWFLAVKNLHLRCSDRVNLPLLQLVVFFSDSLLSLDVERAFGLQNFDLHVASFVDCLCSDLVFDSSCRARFAHTSDSLEE